MRPKAVSTCTKGRARYLLGGGKALHTSPRHGPSASSPAWGSVCACLAAANTTHRKHYANCQPGTPKRRQADAGLHHELQPRAPSAQGVGDDCHGWAADGQNAALWHDGQSKAWNVIWPHEFRPANSNIKHATTEMIVGVCVDLDRQQLCFASDGTWDKKPSFGPEEIREGLCLFPAISLKGRAGFNFGPNFTHSPPPEFVDRVKRWPGTHSSIVRVDNPRLGNEEMLNIYKEVQIHGEVSFKRNVQRLVANSKYREAPKISRSWALTVSRAGPWFSGTYRRVGAHEDKPMYRSSTNAVVYYDAGTRRWRINDKADFSSWHFSAPSTSSCSQDPPRLGWEAPDDRRGVITGEHFRKALQELGINGGEVQRLLGSLAVSDHETGVERVFRVRRGVTLEAQWGRLTQPPCSAAEAWEMAATRLRRQLLEEAGLGGAEVIETCHPYEARRHQWRRTVRLRRAEGLSLHFTSRSCTLDGKARFRVQTGGLDREAAGVGARVEVPLQGGGTIHGTVAGRGPDRSWRVCLDRRHRGTAASTIPRHSVADTATWPCVGDVVDGLYRTGIWHRATVTNACSDGTFLLDWHDCPKKDRKKNLEELSEVPQEVVMESHDLEDHKRYASVPCSGQDCFALCQEEPTKISVLYQSTIDALDDGWREQRPIVGTVGAEISSFALHRDNPLMPICIEGFHDEGPAQQQGVKKGWFLDLAATFSGPSQELLANELLSLGGADAGELVDAAFQDVETLHSRLNERLLAMSDVMLVFTNSCSSSAVALLPEAQVQYRPEQRVGEEVRRFSVNRGRIFVMGFVEDGVAQMAGVRAGWQVDLKSTQSWRRSRLPFTDKEVIENPGLLLDLTGVMLGFRQPNPAPSQRFQGSGTAGPERWRTCELPGDSADFEFSTDGDGAHRPERRWGIWALVCPQGPRDLWAPVAERAVREFREETTGVAPLSDEETELQNRRAIRDAVQREVDALAERWELAMLQSMGTSEEPEVQRDGWDEARLRSLCERHSWDFEWMTEDGERRRRAGEVWDLTAARLPSRMPSRLPSLAMRSLAAAEDGLEDE